MLNIEAVTRYKPDRGYESGITRKRKNPEVNQKLAKTGQNNEILPDSLRQYIQYIQSIPLLTPKQEVDLAKRVEEGKLARQSLAESEANLGQEEQVRLQSMVNDGSAAFESLLEANTRLVISIARKYTGRGVPFLDLIQEGNIGLIRAAKKFDYRRGYKFSTYVTWWIRQAVSRAIAEKARMIRVPVHMDEQITKMYRVINILTQEFGREPTVEELATKLEISLERVEKMISASRFVLSLEAPVEGEDGSDTEFGDYQEDTSSPSPEEQAEVNIRREQIEEVLESLPPREATLLKLRFGLDGGKAMTLEEVGRRMGVTRERVRQIEAQALARLRQSGIQAKLRQNL